MRQRTFKQVTRRRPARPLPPLQLPAGDEEADEEIAAAEHLLVRIDAVLPASRRAA